MHFLNKQEIYEKVKTHLLAQGRRANNVNGSGCYLRSPENPALKCAVGVLIDDEFYKPEMEGMFSVTPPDGMGDCYKLQYAGLMLSGVDPWEYGQLLKDLQIVHDSHDVEEWPLSLAAVAAKHGLHDASVQDAWAPSVSL